MTTERIDIIVREDGSRVVKRNISDIGNAADDAANSLDLMKSILTGLIAGGIITGLIRMADTYTNIQNKLRLVTTGTENLARVTKELKNIANDTRSDFEATAELYARLANSSKELGVGQKQLLCQCRFRLADQILLPQLINGGVVARIQLLLRGKLSSGILQPGDSCA